jgi:hypothetical protein
LKEFEQEFMFSDSVTNPKKDDDAEMVEWLI